jgi:acyl-CoA thioester hydrolase
MTQPSYGQVMQLPALFTGTVPRDPDGPRMHMAVQDHFAHGIAAVLELCRRIGLDEEFAAVRRSCPITAANHSTYLGELFEGERFSVHGRLLARSEKVLHMMAFLVDQERQAVASTLEAVFLHFDLSARRSAPLPADIAKMADDLLVADSNLDWDAPVCGVLGIRS